MSQTRRNLLAAALALSVGLAALAAILVFGGVLPPFEDRNYSDADYGPPTIAVEFVDFSDLSGWPDDSQGEAIPAFLRSCDVLAGLADDAPANPKEALGESLAGASLSGVAGDWRAACDAAQSLARVPEMTGAAARAFFERHFRPARIVDVRAPKPEGAARRRPARMSATGLFTGYFEPIYDASPTPSEEFPAPVLARPDNLVMADLGEFRVELAGQRLAGYVEKGRLIPYPDHREINSGALGEGARALAWLDADDLLFMQIQGSGRLKFPDGRELRVGYDGQNGHLYASIGKTLVDRGAMALEDVSMQSIRAWLDEATPQAAREMRETNPSYVFFRPLGEDADPALGPIGSGETQLTAGRSLAVDRRYFAMGAPMWVSIPAVEGETKELRRLMIAQDSGGAIRGPVRGDIFFGSGPAAGEEAGLFRAEGEIVALIPAAVAARLAIERARTARRGAPR
ncbi:MAG: murein transglycosylase A [Parvularculaceae bacterium]